MPLTNGPNLGLLTDGPQGAEHYQPLMARWRGIDALVQPRALTFLTTAPPGSPADGDAHIVPAGASGAWSGHANHIARWSTATNAWEFYTPRSGWIFWVTVAGIVVWFDGAAWRPLTPGIYEESSALLLATPNNSGRYTRFSHGTAVYLFDAAESYQAGAEYHARYMGDGVLELAADNDMILNPPTNGSLYVPPGGTVTIKIIAADQADVMGVTNQPESSA